MIIAAAMLMNLKVMMTNLAHQAANAAPARQECHVRVVSHRFVGKPGTTFKYDGDEFSIPKSGSIELISSRSGNTYELAGRKLPLNVFPVDDFGTETVSLPADQQPTAASTVAEAN